MYVTSVNQLEADRVFKDKAAFKAYRQSLNITHSRHVQIITAGALVGSLLANGLPADMGIVSDEAGQFNVFRHALCWIPVERNINKLVPLNPTHAKPIKWVRAQVWELYANLKQYKTKVTCQNTPFVEMIQAHFDELCRTRTTYQALSEQLKRLARRKRELLRVLDDPALPLHNNLSERDIREYVKRRKISGSTRSEVGRQCRDTFASLKKTCRKHSLSFWRDLCDRVSCQNSISPLVDYLRQAASASTC